MEKFNLTPEQIKDKLRASLKDSDATLENQVDAIVENMFSIAENSAKQVKAEYAELGHVQDEAILAARGIHVLTAEETKFYNEASKSGGFNSDTVLPETIIERVFDDLQKEHPLLKLINFGLGVAKEKIIRSRRKGKAVWGNLHKDIEGQLDADFGAEEITQLKLTAFMLISNDTLELGARWIDRYVRLCLSEAISEAWEEAIIDGDGKDKPLGLMRKTSGDTGGVFPAKEKKGDLTFKDSATIIKEFAALMKGLSTYKRYIGSNDTTGSDEVRKVDGKVHLIVNPSDYYDIVARATVQNVNGAYVTNLPFIPADHIIESIYVPKGKLIAYVEGEYNADVAMKDSIRKSEERFILEDATLYVTKLLGNGRPTNADAAHVYEIKIPS